MLVLLFAESMGATALVYVLGAAFVRNLFYPKIVYPRLVVGFLFASILTTLLAMIFAEGNTWQDASEKLLDSSWKSVAAVLAILALTQLSSKTPTTSDDADKEPVESIAEAQPEIQDFETARQLSSINDQANVGLLSEQEAETKRAELFKK